MFWIVQTNNVLIDLFKHPGFVDESMTLEWIDVLTNKGSPNTKGGHLHVCHFDLLNLHFSGMISWIHALTCWSKQLKERSLKKKNKLDLWSTIMLYSMFSHLLHTQTHSLVDKLKGIGLVQDKGKKHDPISDWHYEDHWWDLYVGAWWVNNPRSCVFWRWWAYKMLVMNSWDSKQANCWITLTKHSMIVQIQLCFWKRWISCMFAVCIVDCTHQLNQAVPIKVLYGSITWDSKSWSTKEVPKNNRENAKTF